MGNQNKQSCAKRWNHKTNERKLKICEWKSLMQLKEKEKQFKGVISNQNWSYKITLFDRYRRRKVVTTPDWK